MRLVMAIIKNIIYSFTPAIVEISFVALDLESPFVVGRCVGIISYETIFITFHPTPALFHSLSLPIKFLLSAVTVNRISDNPIFMSFSCSPALPYSSSVSLTLCPCLLLSILLLLCHIVVAQIEFSYCSRIRRTKD